MTVTDSPSIRKVSSTECGVQNDEGTPCTLGEFHTGRHSWGTGKRSNLTAVESVKALAPVESAFNNDEYLQSDALENIARTLTANYDELKHLRGQAIDFFWKKHGGFAKGKTRLGDTKKLSGLTRHFADGTPFVIWLAADHLEGWGQEQIEPLVFHYQLRCGVDEDGDQYIVAPDFEGFVPELKRYGAWRADLRLAVRTVQQLSLPLVEEEPETVEEAEEE